MKRKLFTVLVAVAVAFSMAGVSFASENADAGKTEAQFGANKIADKALVKIGADKGAVSEAAAKATGDVWLDNVTATGFTLHWNKPTIQSGTSFVRYEVKEGETTLYICEDYNTTYRQFSNLKPGTVSRLTVNYYYKRTGGSEISYIIGSTEVNTLPITISTEDIGPSWVLSKSISFGTSFYPGDINATGVQFEVSKYNGTVIKTVERNISVNISNNKGYKYRARAYHKNYSNDQTYYGDWSGYRYFATPSAKIKSASKKIKITIKKAEGVKAYKVYVSSKKDSAYKLAKTIKVKSKKSYTTTITKYGKKKLKKGKTYYFEVRPVMKNGKMSDVVGNTSMWVR